jgi:hypothetical protein
MLASTMTRRVGASAHPTRVVGLCRLRVLDRLAFKGAAVSPFDFGLPPRIEDVTQMVQ